MGRNEESKLFYRMDVARNGAKNIKALRKGLVWLLKDAGYSKGGRHVYNPKDSRLGVEVVQDSRSRVLVDVNVYAPFGTKEQNEDTFKMAQNLVDYLKSDIIPNAGGMVTPNGEGFGAYWVEYAEESTV